MGRTWARWALLSAAVAGLPGGFSGGGRFPAIARPPPLRAPDAHCDRAVSRRVRKEVESMLNKRVNKEVSKEYVYPMACPLSKDNDRFLPHETAKKHRYKGRQDGEYECKLCGKKFKNEHYMDLHLDRVHSDVVVGPTCLADYCRVFGVCEKRAVKQKAADCNATVVDDARKLCEDAVMSCFPATGPARFLGAELRRSLCGMLDCEARQLKETQTKEGHTEVAVLVIVFFFVIIVSMLLLLVCFENGDEALMWIMNLECGATVNRWKGELSKRLLRFRDKAQKDTGMRKHRSI